MIPFHLIALRGEAALKARFPKEAKKNATVIPYEKGMGPHMLTADHGETTKWEHHCTQDMLQQVYKGSNFTYRFTQSLIIHAGHIYRLINAQMNVQEVYIGSKYPFT